MCLHASVISSNCELELRIKKTDYCTEEGKELDSQRTSNFWHCDVVDYGREWPFLKASKGETCTACRCESVAKYMKQDM